MDGFLNFLANYYIWFLVAAGIFLFALIGLIIDSAKKRKSKNAEMIEGSADAPVESFRYEEVATPVETTTQPTEETITEVGATQPTTPAQEEVTTVIEPTITEVSAPTFDGAPVNDFPVEGPAPVDVQTPTPTEVPAAPVAPAPVMDATPVIGKPEVVTTVENPTTIQ